MAFSSTFLQIIHYGALKALQEIKLGRISTMDQVKLWKGCKKKGI